MLLNIWSSLTRVVTPPYSRHTCYLVQDYVVLLCQVMLCCCPWALFRRRRPHRQANCQGVTVACDHPVAPQLGLFPSDKKCYVMLYYILVLFEVPLNSFKIVSSPTYEVLHPYRRSQSNYIDFKQRFIVIVRQPEEDLKM